MFPARYELNVTIFNIVLVFKEVNVICIFSYSYLQTCRNCLSFIFVFISVRPFSVVERGGLLSGALASRF